MIVRIIYNADKSFSVVHPVPNSKRIDETEAQWLERVLSKATPKGAIFEDVEHTELPTNREERAGWEKEHGKPVTVNKKKVDEFKAKRAEELAIADEIKLMAKERIAKMH